MVYYKEAISNPCKGSFIYQYLWLVSLVWLMADIAVYFQMVSEVGVQVQDFQYRFSRQVLLSKATESFYSHSSTPPQPSQLVLYLTKWSLVNINVNKEMSGFWFAYQEVLTVLLYMQTKNVGKDLQKHKRYVLTDFLYR